MADVLVDGRSCKGVDWPVTLTPEDIPFDDGLGGRGSLGRTDCDPVVASAGNSLRGLGGSWRGRLSHLSADGDGGGFEGLVVTVDAAGIPGCAARCAGGGEGGATLGRRLLIADRRSSIVEGGSQATGLLACDLC